MKRNYKLLTIIFLIIILSSGAGWLSADVSETPFSAIKVAIRAMFGNTAYVSSETDWRAADAAGRSSHFIGDINLTSDFTPTQSFSTNNYSIDGPYNLIINGYFTGSMGCFGSSVNISGLTYAKPEWWDASAGDDATECSIATNKAIASLSGGEICFAKGRIYMLTPGVVAGKGNIQYTGGGILKAYPRDYSGLPDANVYPLIQFADNEDNIVIEKLIFDGNSASQTNRARLADDTTGLDALYFGACDNVRIERCEFRDFRGAAWNMVSDPKSNWFTNNNKFYNLADGFAYWRYITDIEIGGNIGDTAGVIGETDCSGGPCQGNGFLVGSCVNALVHDNILKNISRKGIYFTSGSAGAAHDNMSSNNYVEASFWTGIDISKNNLRVKSVHDTVYNVGADGDGITITGISGSESIDCQILNPDIATVDDHGIQVTYATGAIIQGGKIRNAGLVGISEDNSTDVVIDSVDISGSGNEGVKTESAGTLVKRCRIAASGSHSINVNADNNVIDANEIDGGGTQRGVNIAIGQDVVIKNNLIFNTSIGIVFSSTETMGSPKVVGNTVDTCTTRAVSWAGTTNMTQLLLQGNTYINTTAILHANLNNNSYIPVFHYDQQGQRITVTASAAPANGTWSQGDISFNASPTANGSIGWVCISGGTPGTWKGFGAIDP